MHMKSRYQIQIPELDILSYLFAETGPGGEQPAFLDYDDTSKCLSRRELKDRIRQLGKGLIEETGLRQGDVVMTCAMNDVQSPVTFLGAVCAGGIFCGSNPSQTVPELEYFLHLTKPKVIFVDEESIPLVSAATEHTGSKKPFIFTLGTSESATYKPISSLFKYGIHDWEMLKPDELSSRVALLAFSSGTTGRPKACMITHKNLVTNAHQKLFIEGDLELDGRVIRHQRKYTAYLPMYHVLGLILCCIATIKLSAPTVVMKRYSLPRLLNMIERHKITHLVVVPPIAAQMVHSPLALEYRRDSVWSSPLSDEIKSRLGKIFTHKDFILKEAWGMTEITGVGTILDKRQGKDNSGVGFLVPNMEATVVDDHGQPVSERESGEILLKGPNVFIGYWNNPDAIAKTFTSDGWLKTGDLAIIEPTGRVYIVGRKKELIKVKGFQVAPAELEAVLLGHDGVLDCAVIGVHRNDRECPQAHIVSKNSTVTAQSINDYLNTRVSKYKRLTGGVVFTSAIPRSASGKILRRSILDPQAEKARL